MCSNKTSLKFIAVLLLSILSRSQQISKNHGNRLLRYPPFANVLEGSFDSEEDLQSVMKQCDELDFIDKNRLKMILTGITDDTLDPMNEKRGSNNYHNSYGESSNLPITPIKPSSCSCATYSKYIDLGRFHFPRYLKTIVCNESLCLGCQKRTYFVHILRPRIPNDDNNLFPTESIQQVPKQINKEWIFEEKEVVTGCECMSKQSRR